MKKTILILAAMLALVSCESIMDILESAVHDRVEHEDTSYQPSTSPIPTVSAKPSSEYDAKDDDGPFGSYYDYRQISIAKGHAIAENRPLLLVASMDPCAHCDNFSARILRTRQFRQFVIENRIVVCETKDNNLMLAMKNAYRASRYKGYFSGAPYVYLFKIDDASKSGRDAFVQVQADLLKSSSTGLYFVGSYKAGESFMGIPTGAEASWNPSTFIKQIKACFPNQHFKE